MSEIVLANQNLPDTLEDLAKFVIVCREKANAIRAEIRVIEKLELAQEIRDQKREEMMLLGDVLLDAEVRLGELFSQLPTNQGKRTDIAHSNSGVTKFEKLKDLGFSKMQASRLETLADNKNIVELVKAKARENGEFPTRARVLDLAAYKKRKAEEYEQFLDDRVAVYKEYSKMMEAINRFKITDYRMEALRDNFDGTITAEHELGYIGRAKDKLATLEMEIRKPKKRKFLIN